MKHLPIFFLLLVKFSINNCQRLDLEGFREWKQLDFKFPNDDTRNEAIAKKLFVVKNTFPIDVDVDYQGKIRLLFNFK